jgi:putative PEP-CTERM system TPR-repeat lipoprotein
MSDTSLSALERINGICDRFNEAWPARPRPRVSDFLHEAPEEDRPELRDALLGEAVFRIKADQCQRWGQGERVSVEEYLREDPALREGPERVLELVDNELALRRQRGESPRAEEYLALLPGHEAELRRRFAGGQEVIPPTVDEPRAPDTMQPVTGAETLPANSRPGEPPLPDLGHYRPVAFIGRGGVGDVFLYYDPQMDRELAVKVLREDHRGNPSLVHRFRHEARLNARLQHPNVVPVHAMERTADGRPYFTMKLVRGRTLADLLAERAGPAEDLPRLLGIFEQVCQAVAYAHSQGVIHRDLKPHNVMVGAFAEVQVMDWGLAKVVGPAEEGEAAPAGPEAWAAGPPAGVDGEAQPTRAGQVMGTLAYMPPEQARGEVGEVDRRSDVFGLGAILCEVLTGQPPFDGQDESERWARARACDHAAALALLEGCGADAELVGLCKACLAAGPADRPGDAGEVARAVAAYQAEVQKRLQAAERERAAAQARAEEARKTAAAERQARRRTLALAAAVLLLVCGGGGVTWWRQHRQQAVDTAVDNGLREPRELVAQAESAPLAAPGQYRAAAKAAHNAGELARRSGAAAKLQGEAAALAIRLEREAEAADRDRRLLARLPDVRGPQEGPKFRADDKGFLVQLPEPSADEQFAEAFREWGLDVDATPTAEAAARLGKRPVAVVVEVVAALDEWASERRRPGRQPEERQRLANLAAALDGPDSKRREVRAILARGNLPVERALGELSRILLPPAGLTDVVPGEDRNRLRQLTEGMDAAAEPVLSLVLLVRALRVAGDDARAERLLRAAVRARPQEVVLRYALGRVLTGQRPPKWREAVECYEATRALRPQFGAGLAWALVKSGRAEDGLALYARLVAERPDNPWLHTARGNALYDLDRYREAEVACREAIRLKPDYPEAYIGLGVALNRPGKLEEAEAAYREALRLKPDDPGVHFNLGSALRGQGRPKEAEAECRVALRLKPDYSEAHTNLGNVLLDQGRTKEAEAEFRDALRLKPILIQAYIGLGAALLRQGRPKEAEAECRVALRLKPDYAEAHTNLGIALADQGRPKEAQAEFREALRLKPGLIQAHYGLGSALSGQGRPKEAEAEYREALRLKPSDPVAHYELGSALLDQGRPKEAEAEFREALRLKPGDPAAHNGIGSALLGQGKPKEAEAEFREALRLRRDDPKAHNNLGNALLDQGRPKEAEAEYREALRLKPDDPVAHTNLGSALLDQGRPKEAEAEHREALRLRPGYPAAHNGLGSALWGQSRSREAQAEFREALRLKPDFPAAHVNLGNALMAQDMPKEAEAEFREALRLNKDHLSAAHAGLGNVLYKQGRLKEAEAEYREALRLKPDDPVAHNGLGNALWGQSRLKEAEAEYREALRLKPDYPEAHNNLGNALSRQGKPKEAEAEYREALRLKPEYPKARYNLGNALGKQGRPKEAEAEYREALRLKPDYPEAHYNLGNALLDQGRPKEAEAEYREALRLKPDYPEAHNGLGNALLDQGRPKEAEAEHREALRLKQGLIQAHYNLGNALSRQGKPKEAEAEYREASASSQNTPRPTATWVIH